jgi:N-acetylneuraminic acid mutarotase
MQLTVVERRAAGAEAVGNRRRGRAALLAGVLGLVLAFLPADEASAACTAEGRTISPLDCSQVLVTMPYSQGFDRDAGGIVDGAGVGTGFTMVDPSTAGTGYVPANLAVNAAAPGTLGITTTSGLSWASSDSQDNALGVGIRPGRTVLLTTTLINPPAGSARYEQAGLWFGNNEDNYVKFDVISFNTGETKIELGMEVAGATSISKRTTGSLSLSGARVALRLRADPATGQVSASYSINGGAWASLATVTAPAAFFSSDAAGIDPTIGTNSFGGVYTSHRNGATRLTYRFDSFSLEDVTPSQPPPTGGISINRFSIGATVSQPTAMVFGPDGRLYVTELMGKIHALTLNSARQVTSDQVITSLGTRLTLGVAIDPASTAAQVILWVSHSDPNLSGPSSTSGSGGAPANSSAIARITVDPTAKTATRASPDPVTGLPRSQGNHSINGLDWGPPEADGSRKLYIALGGNTGAGSPNMSPESLGEFGLREEQPLSAAILVADVKMSGFDGSCANTTDIYGPPPCSVTTFATGIRNAYDLIWHSNGSLYAPDNGAAVGPTFPPSPTPPCTGSAPYPANDPGDQNDLLLRVLGGRYYGHPDPHRLPSPQCVFKDGSWQGVAPLTNYQRPISDLGPKKSADGIIEYKSGAFGGQLRGNLLITNYSVGDDITRVVLSADGTSVTAKGSLAGGFADPLPIAEGPDGTIYVGEFAGAKITALVPTSGGVVGTWTTKASLPVAILDGGGTALNGKLYFAAGKTSAGPRRTLYVYDPATNAWTTGPSLPAAYPAVENPAVVATGGKLYLFGGSTGPFSGATTTAAVYDPATNAWKMLAPMATGRGGPTAQAIGTKIYVAGGMDTTGASLATVEAYDPATNAWSAAAPMNTRRDNPGSASLGGKVYVFGGRTRNADGTSVSGQLATVERYDPATNTWAGRAPMPTGRRSVVVGLRNGRAQVIGGERSTTTSGTFPQNEEYDPLTNTWRSLASIPTPRHGAVAGTINGMVYVVGGGPTTGSSYSAVNQAFTY